MPRYNSNIGPFADIWHSAISPLSKTKDWGQNLSTALPIDDVLPELLAALATHNHAVLQAPPGAGKTTRVPLALLNSAQVNGRILMLEPRRLATRAAAERMAETLGEKVGQTIGYRIRGENHSSKATKIEVVTEGILTRMIQSDPELPGIGAVIFDEFHERSLQADLGLALCLEIRAALRPDLMLLVMSATLDAEPVAELMGNAPVVTSMGQIFPVETRWLDQPWAKPNQRGPFFETVMADLVFRAIKETTGGILVFLPGEGEIRRVEALLKKAALPDVSLHPLFGAMPFKAQRAAIAPATSGRKVVLATSIAETSLTIQDVRVVVDGGKSRRARFDPPSGMSRLVTERVSKAEATQRQGRAGRLAPGICYRMWSKGEEGGLAPFPPAEIEAADLTPLLLECAMWGVTDPAELPFLTKPNASAVDNARALLQSLGALDHTGAITEHGREMAGQPLHPRLAHMLLKGGKDAPLLAAMLSERDVLGGAGMRPPADLDLRWQAVKNPAKFATERPYAINRSVLSRIQSEVKRLRNSGSVALDLADMAALAYPDRIGLRRKGDAARYVLSGGKGAVFRGTETLGASRLIVATDLDGDKREAKIRMAIETTEAGLHDLFPERFLWREICEWSRRERAVLTRKQQVFGALVLSELNWRDCPPDQISAAMCVGLRDLGFVALPFNKAALLLIGRIEWLRVRGADMPDCSNDGLLAGLESWLGPLIGACRKVGDLKALDLTSALLNRLSWAQRQQLDELAPAAITAPTGTKLAVDYSGAQPSVSVRLQEMFGLMQHPLFGPDQTPLLIELLSPAGRAVQVTADLPGFWQNSYTDVRKDMRGRYPKHPWPEDPTVAEPTRRRKPRTR
ncbi:MAG: ATP-dependent helicase HrpB [Candidatus Paceibacteria bacterium]